MDPTATPRAQRSRESTAEGRNTEVKRRKVRKGTRSCWECKRRKMKCLFEEPTDRTCVGCQQRRTKCVSQEFPEERSVRIDQVPPMNGRMVRVEALVEQLMKKIDSGETASRRETTEDGGDLGVPTPASGDSESSRFLALFKPPEENAVEKHDLGSSHGADSIESTSAGSPGKYSRLSRILYESLPSRDDTERILATRGDLSRWFHAMLIMPLSTLDQNGVESVNNVLEIPGPNKHPVLIARHMLFLAIALQHLLPDAHAEIEGLSEPSQTIMTRLADTAISLVTTNDEILGSIESLECMMMESRYQSNRGNLRRGWMAVRRALMIAQLMNLHRSRRRPGYRLLDPKNPADPQHLWSRIVACDRLLCLMLGLPQGSLDHSMASDQALAQDTPMGRLERAHSVLSSRILERNESGTDDFEMTHEIDWELRKVAKSLPSKWWSTPNPASVINEPKAMFWETQRLVDQLFHYNLLNQLHLPHMLRSATDVRYEYSKIMCVNASREMLSRFLQFRSFNQSVFCHRAVDFFALVAAMTLLLAHLDSHRSSQHDFLAHQCQSDRAMIEQVQKCMEQVWRMNSDALSAQSVDLLRRLLAIEIDVTEGCPHRGESVKVSVQTPEAEEEVMQPDAKYSTSMRLYIPYFGVITIAREGVRCETRKDLPGAGPSQGRTSSVEASRATRHGRDAGIDGMSPFETNQEHAEQLMSPPLASDVGAATSALPAELPVIALSHHMENDFASQFPSAVSDPVLQQYDYPGLIASVDDWAFQGVDKAFFDNLMREL